MRDYVRHATPFVAQLSREMPTYIGALNLHCPEQHRINEATQRLTIHAL